MPMLRSCPRPACAGRGKHMPKKTKKQKLLAHDHRKHLSLPIDHTYQSQSLKNNDTFRLTVPAISQPQTVTVSINEFIAIKRDIVKTLLITAGIIVCELLLSRYLPK